MHIMRSYDYALFNWYRSVMYNRNAVDCYNRSNISINYYGNSIHKSFNRRIKPLSIFKMKEQTKTSIWHFTLYVIAAFVAIVIAMHLTSCTHRSYDENTDEDSLYIANILKDYNNPKFDNVGKVLRYKEDLSSNYYEDSVFNSMSPTLVYNIATVVINRDGWATIKSIVKEYDKGRLVYDNLPKSIPDSVVRSSTEYSIHDTVIDGKKATIKTTIDYE